MIQLQVNNICLSTTILIQNKTINKTEEFTICGNVLLDHHGKQIQYPNGRHQNDDIS